MTTETARIAFTEDQVKAKDALIAFVKSNKSMFTMGGFAGTGKTTVLSETIAELRAIKRFEKMTVAFCCYTGKAATVLREKLENAKAIQKSDYCGTIHGLIYKPIWEEGKIERWEKVNQIPHDIIIIDEGSMIGETIFNDLKSYGVPIVAVGDHGQLPPVCSKFNLMENPMVRLEKIHRQAETNPIIKLSLMARNGEQIPYGGWVGAAGESVMKTPGIDKYIDQLDKYMVLCAMNKTRVDLNRKIRSKLQNSSVLPSKGETVICLKNNRKQGIFNGMTGIVEESSSVENPDFYKMKVRFHLLGFEWNGTAFKHQLNRETTLRSWKNFKTGRELYDQMTIGNLFDFGYALTVHKAQGSQSENVLLIEEKMPGFSKENMNRWLYTGITRSSRNLVIVSSLS